jgi:hypothetical protein
VTTGDHERQQTPRKFPECNRKSRLPRSHFPPCLLTVASLMQQLLGDMPTLLRTTPMTSQTIIPFLRNSSRGLIRWKSLIMGQIPYNDLFIKHHSHLRQSGSHWCSGYQPKESLKSPSILPTSFVNWMIQCSSRTERALSSCSSRGFLHPSSLTYWGQGSKLTQNSFAGM